MNLPWSDTPELSESAVNAISTIITMEDELKRYKFALVQIEYFSAYIESNLHSRFSMVCSQAAQDPELFKNIGK